MMKIKYALVVTALIVGIASGANAGVRTATTYEDSRATAPNIVTKGGPIRLGTNVYAHANETHAVIGITDVYVENCNLIILHDWEAGERVLSADAEEDETISRLGVQAGISGGGNKSTIQLWRDGQKICPGAALFGTDKANLWVNVTTVKPDVN